MKKIVVLFFLIIISVLAGVSYGGVVLALDMPYVYNENDVWLLDRDTGEKLFVLPSTYYAKLDNIDDIYYMVTFNGVKAKIEKDKVSTIGYHTTPKSTICDIQIAEKYRVFAEIKLKATMNGTEDVLVSTNANLIFLGEYNIEDKVWYYVSFEEKKGYLQPEFTTIPEMKFDKFLPEINESQPVVDKIDTEPTKDDEKSFLDDLKNNDLAKILVISGLCLVLVVLIILIFVPSKHRKNRYYYEE
ncbi:MAG: hypothetical protein WCR54_04705 [Clostridia bacterium]